MTEMVDLRDTELILSNHTYDKAINARTQIRREKLLADHREMNMIQTVHDGNNYRVSPTERQLVDGLLGTAELTDMGIHLLMSFVSHMQIYRNAGGLDYGQIAVTNAMSIARLFNSFFSHTFGMQSIESLRNNLVVVNPSNIDYALKWLQTQNSIVEHPQTSKSVAQVFKEGFTRFRATRLLKEAGLDTRYAPLPAGYEAFALTKEKGWLVKKANEDPPDFYQYARHYLTSVALLGFSFAASRLYKNFRPNAHPTDRAAAILVTTILPVMRVAWTVASTSAIHEEYAKYTEDLEHAYGKSIAADVKGGISAVHYAFGSEVAHGVFANNFMSRGFPTDIFNEEQAQEISRDTRSTEE